jgi:hypothetical protein
VLGPPPGARTVATPVRVNVIANVDVAAVFALVVKGPVPRDKK